MDISVIVPCRNLEGYIARCLGSILRQTFDPRRYEIILVFDSCTDGSEEEANAVLANSGAAYSVLHTDVCRAGLARNIGLEAATGDFVWFVDGDDYIVRDDAFALLAGEMRRLRPAALYMTEFESDEPVSDPDAIWRDFCRRSFIAGERFKGYTINEDWEFVKRIATLEKYSQSDIGGIFYHYSYPRPGSITYNFKLLNPHCGYKKGEKMINKKVTELSTLASAGLGESRHTLLSDGAHRLVFGTETIPQTASAPLAAVTTAQPEATRPHSDLTKMNVTAQPAALASLQAASDTGSEVFEQAQGTVIDAYSKDNSGNIYNYLWAGYNVQNYGNIIAYITLSIASVAKLGSVRSVTLRLYGDNNNVPCGLYDASGKSVCSVPGSNDIYLNISSYIEQLSTSNYTFSIECTQRFFYRYFYSPVVYVDYIPAGEMSDGQRYAGLEAGGLTADVDVLFGYPRLSAKLLSLGGEKMPLSLELSHLGVEYAKSNSLNGLASGMPDGWFTNYHRVCYKDGGRYYYIDGKRLKHIFKLAENSTSLYYDSRGTGLLLEAVSGGTKIYDEYGNYMQFDSSGRLTEISEKRSSSVRFSATVSYLEGLKISSVTDGTGRTVSFSYSGTTTSVSFGGAQKYKITSDGSGNVSGIVRVSGSQEETMQFEVDSSGRITKATAASGEYISMTYDSEDRVSQLSSNVGNKSLSFAYDNLLTVVTNEKSVKTSYYFNSRGEFISSYEHVGTGRKSARFVSRDACERYAGGLSEKVEFQLEFGSGNYSKTFTDVTSPVSAETTSKSTYIVDVNRYALFTAAVSVNGGYDSVTDDPVAVQLWDGNGNMLCQLDFDPHVSGTQIAAKPFNVVEYRTGNSNDFYAKVIVNCKCNSIYFSDLLVTPLGAGMKSLCSSVNLSRGGPGSFLTDSDALYYVKENSGVTAGGKTYDVTLYTEDYIANERNYNTRASSSASWNMWYDKKRGLIAGVTEPTVTFPNGGTLGFSGTRFTVLTDNGETVTAVRRTHNRDDFDSAHASYHMRVTEKSFNDSGHISDTYYDENYRAAVTEDEDKKTVTTYSSEGFATSERKELAGDSSVNIIADRVYENGYVVQEKDYLGQSVSTVATSYNSLGGVGSVTAANGFVTGYDYDGFGDRLAEVSGTVTEGGTSAENSNGISYSSGRITSVSHNGFSYGFGYDSYGNINSVTVGVSTYATKTYAYTSVTDTVTTAYGNGDSETREYDKYGRLIKINEYAYYIYCDNEDDGHNASSPTDSGLEISSQSKLYKSRDFSTQSVTYYSYDEYGDLSHISEELYNGQDFMADYYYDSRRRVYKIKYSYAKTGTTTEYATVNYYYRNGNDEKSGEAYKSVVSATGATLTTETAKDGLGRVTGESLGTGSGGTEHEYAYTPRQNSSGTAEGTTDRVSSDTYELSHDGIVRDKRTDTYGYDACRNITSYASATDGKYSNNVTYEYDQMNRLVRENNQVFNRTSVYAYDAGGNITSRKDYAYTTSAPGSVVSERTYTYDGTMKDRLMSYNGQSIAYDACGNPTAYRGGSLSWTRGRLLASHSSGSRRYDFVYDGSGIRRERRIYVSGTLTEYRNYIYEDGRLTAEEYGTENRTQMMNYVYYLYDHNGIIGCVIGGETYYYVKNIFGDIVWLVKASTNEIEAIYEYDAWGSCLVYNGNGVLDESETFVGNINPFRYRGYYYDRDLGLYYLKTRWYDPETGRFLNLDRIEYIAPETLNGLNLYAYCLNNPVMNTDPEGTLPIWLNLLIGGLTIVGLAALSILAPAGGTVALIAGSALKGALTGAAIGAAVGGVTEAIDAAINGEDIFLGAAEGMAAGFASGAVTGMLGGGMGAFSGAGLTGTKLLVHRGMQVGWNMLVGQTAYFMDSITQGGDMGLFGSFASSVSGFAAGYSINFSWWKTAIISFVMEIITWAAGWADEVMQK